ncbi:MAG: hypothetical protein OXG04_21365 [Acidobacteria bacterium]|nr:hypothetical protein [Acidobacteriota bacterium]
MRSLLIFATVLVLTSHVPAHAQFLEDFEERLWGVQVSFTPEWRSEDLGGDLLNLQRLDMSGSDFTVGFARGRMRSGHWGLSLLRQRWKDAAICNDSECFESAGSAWLQGFAANWFLPFGAPFAGDRVQAGMHVDVGGGWLQGTMRVDEVSAAGAPSARAGQETSAAEILPDPWSRVPVPLFRAEAAVAVTVAPGLKVIASGGYGLPFTRRFGVSVAYFPMAARN